MAHENEHAYQAVIDATNDLIDTSLHQYTQDVIDRLVSFGYLPVTSDAFALAFAMHKSHFHVLNETNQNNVPDGLKDVLTDMICGEFLNAKYQTGQLDLSGLDFGGIMQTVSEGDTSVTFDKAGSDEMKFSALINWLITGREGDLICYRRIRW